MGFFSRLWNVIRVRANFLMDKIEKPEDQLSAFMEKLDSQTLKLQKAVASAIVDEKKLKMQIEDHLTQSQSWERKAELALKGGDEELAREALSRKEDCDTQALGLSKNWEMQKTATEQLKASLKVTKEKVADAKRRSNLMLAQYRTVETKQKLATTLSTATPDSPMKHLEQLNDRILQIEAETEAHLELNGSSSADEIEGRFRALESRQKTDDALMQLKTKFLPSGKTKKKAS